MKFLGHLLGITKLDKEKNQCIRGKNGSENIIKEKKTVPEKVATTRTEDGHKQNTKQELQYKPKDEGTQDDRGRDGGNNFILRIKEQEICLTLQEHGDDDDDELTVTNCNKTR